VHSRLGVDGVSLVVVNGNKARNGKAGRVGEWCNGKADF